MSTSSPACFSKLEMESAAISTLMSDLQDKVYFLHYHCLNGRFLLFSLNYFIPFKVSTQQIRLFFWLSLSSCVCPNLKPVNVLFSKRTASVAAVSLLSLCDCFVGSISGGSSSCPSERAALLFMLDTHLLSFQDVCDVWHLIFFFFQVLVFVLGCAFLLTLRVVASCVIGPLIFVNVACFHWVSGSPRVLSGLALSDLVPITGSDTHPIAAGPCPSLALAHPWGGARGCPGSPWLPCSCLRWWDGPWLIALPWPSQGNP